MSKVQVLIGSNAAECIIRLGAADDAKNSEKPIDVYSHNVHEYDAERLGRRLVAAGAVSREWRAAMYHSRRQFAASHDRVALARASELAVIHFVKPLALLRVLQWFQEEEKVGVNEVVKSRR